jgi:hypothetical protein
MTAKGTMDPNPVPVHVASVAPDARSAMTAPARECYRGVYTTVQLTANDPVQCILPEDPGRVEAYVVSLDNDIVIGTQNQVSAAQNTASGTPYPIGAYLQAMPTSWATPPFCVKDCNAVYAGVTTTETNSRVTVAAYYRSAS